MAVNNNFRNSVPSLVQPLATLFPAPIVAKRAPTANDINYPLGQEWVYPATNSLYFLTSVLAGAATWILVETGGGAGVFASLTVTPGPTSITGTTNINTAGAGVTSINTGGTGALNLGNATGNTAVTGSLTTTTAIAAGTTVTAGTGLFATSGGVLALAGDITASTGNIASTLGSVSAGTTVTAGTGITATTGNITATNGNVVLSTATNKVVLPGPVDVKSGAGVPANGLALHAGDLYLNTTPTGATDRIFVATGVGAWTNVTCAA